MTNPYAGSIYSIFTVEESETWRDECPKSHSISDGDANPALTDAKCNFPPFLKVTFISNFPTIKIKDLFIILFCIFQSFN